MFIKKSVFIVLICFLVAAAAVTVGFIVKSEADISTREQATAYSYQKSFSELAESLENINIGLQKSLYASTPYQAMTLAASVWRDAGAAKTSLEELPTQTLNLQVIPKFLNQSGEYILSLAKKLMNGAQQSESEKQTAKTLSESARALSQQMSELSYRVSTENLAYNDLLSFIQLNDTPEMDESITAMSEDGDKAGFTSENSLLNMENALELPILNYDGPFSEHLSRRESVFLENKEAISDAEAKNRAAYILGCNLSDLEQGDDVSDDGMKCFTFGGEQLYIALTMRQGYPLYFTKTREIADIGISDEKAIKAGSDFLISLRIAGMECISYNTEGNILTGEYVFNHNGVYCYPDMIKVSVALDNGDIIALDAHDYLLAHTVDRRLRPSLSEEIARERITAVTAGEGRLCVIPSNNTESGELLCYEFECDGEGTELLVYINAHSGIEEDIKINTGDENGTGRR